jgi:hypothetical protein
VIAGTARRAPDTADTKFSAATLVALIRAIKLSPCVRSANFKTPAFRFGMFERFFDFLFRMNGSPHIDLKVKDIQSGCQLTTISR